MKTKILFILICIRLLADCNLQFSQNITNTLGTLGVFKIKDGAADYLTLSQSTGQVNILKTLRLENTTSSSLGIIFKGTESFLHNYGAANTFLGVSSGNFTMSGPENTAVGFVSLSSNTTDSQNTAIGTGSLYSNTNGSNNTAVGYSSLITNTGGNNNTALGYRSLYSNTLGYSNTAVGTFSLYSNTSSYNTAVGDSSLYSNTASTNTAVGYASLRNNTTGINNTAVGNQSLYANTLGFENTAVGYQSLYSNKGTANTALGNQSLFSNTTGESNSAFGYRSLYSNTTGTNNSAFGYRSLYYSTGNNNSAFGLWSLLSTTGNSNSAFGHFAASDLTSGSNVTCIGFDSQPSSPSASNQINLGNGGITLLRCAVTTITAISDARDKKNITDLSLGLNFITKLKPRQFNWDKREWYDDNISDGSKMKESPTAGFIAQELDEVQTTQNAEWLNLVLKDNPEKWEATPGNLLPIVVKAIQDLKAENDVLKDKLAKFEQVQELLVNEIEKLKSKDKDIKEVKLGEK